MTGSKRYSRLKRNTKSYKSDFDILLRAVLCSININYLLKVVFQVFPSFFRA